MKGEAEAMFCKSRFSGADFSDLKEGAAHSASVVVANHHKLLDTSHRGGCHPVDKLLHGDENVVCADDGYTGVEKRLSMPTEK